MSINHDNENFYSEFNYFIKRYIRDAWRYRSRTGIIRFIKDIYFEICFKIKYPRFKYLIKIYADANDIPIERVDHYIQCESNSTFV